MPWFDPLALALILVGLTSAAVVSRRYQVGSSGFWMMAWALLAGAGLMILMPTGLPGADAIGAILVSSFPVLICAGAFRYAGRPVPRALIAGGAVFCLVRGVLVGLGLSTQELLLSLAVSPLLLLAAAIVILPQTIALGGVLQRILPLGLIALAGLEAFDALTGLTMLELWSPISGWLALGIPVALFQLAANIELTTMSLDQTRGERDKNAAALAETVEQLLETQGQMEQRIQDRTVELRAEVAERKRIEEELRISEERYRCASELASDYMIEARFSVDHVLRIEWMTGAFSRISGYGEEEAMKLDWIVALMHPDDLESVALSLRSVLDGNEEEIEFRIITREGEHRWVRTRTAAIRDEATGELIIYSAGHDVTDERAAADQHSKLLDRVREAQKLESLGALAGGVAHDFNNLLSVILGNASILASEIPKDSPLHSRAQRIQISSRMAAELTNQMLTYAGSAPRMTGMIDLTRLVEEMATLLDSGDVRIATELEDGLPQISGGAAQIRQVVLNLVTNASEALVDGGGEVRLCTGVMHADAEYLSDVRASENLKEGEFVYLEVSDTGAGMDAETLARLFDPFFSTKLSGRGLGLAVVQGIVRSHAGGIKVESREGEGTTFRVLFPVGPNDSAEAADSMAGSEPKSLLGPMTGGAILESGLAAPTTTPGGTILVIDDEEPVRELAEIILGAAGFHVLLAESGEEGLELYAKNVEQIALVLLDLTMPGTSGEEVLSELRKCTRNVPVLIASGYTHEIAAKRTGPRERTDFIQKPYEPEDLIESVLRMLTD